MPTKKFCKRSNKKFFFGISDSKELEKVHKSQISGAGADSLFVTQIYSITDLLSCLARGTYKVSIEHKRGRQHLHNIFFLASFRFLL
jgi:hypothetical protein